MRIARVLSKTVGRPRVALERDGHLYDVEALERAFSVEAGAPSTNTVADSVRSSSEPSDFQTRIGTLRCDGLYDLDMRLIRGSRPRAALLSDDDVMLLAPCDTERATFLQVDTRSLAQRGEPTWRIGQARSLCGQDGLVAIEGSAPVLEIGLAAVIGDDLSRASPREASNAIMGLSMAIDWLGHAQEDDPSFITSSLRGVAAQLGPFLVSRYVVPRVGEASVLVAVGGVRRAKATLGAIGLSVEEAIAFVSGRAELRAGDVVSVGPVPIAIGPVAHHDRVEVEVEGLGLLRGIPVERRQHAGWRSG